MQGLLIFSDHPALIEARARVAAAAIRLKLPANSAARYDTDAGLLMSYGMDIRDDYKLSAAYVVKVRQGAKPGDLPVELPTTTELALNLETAAALGITIPHSCACRHTASSRKNKKSPALARRASDT